MKSEKLRSPAAALSLLALNIAVCWRLFTVEFTGHFGSIEGSFIAIARYLSQHWGDSSWWPLWHCGMPYQDTYVPLLHLVVAATARFGHISAAHAYHSVIGVTYALGPVALYFLAVRLGASRGAAFLGALFYSLLSPSAFLMHNIRVDVGSLWYARRLQVLTMYGEGPHITAMTMMPIVILALESALQRRTTRSWVLAAISMAVVFLTNVPGTMALALAIFCWLCAQPKENLRRAWVIASSAAVMAYCLACYGLPPSSVKTVVGNVGPMHSGFSNSMRHGPLTLLLVFAVTAAVGFGMTRLRVPLLQRFAILFFALVAVIAIPANVDTYELLPQAGRLHLEMEIGICLLLGSAVWTLYTFVPRWLRPIVLALALAPIGIQLDNYQTRAAIDVQPVDLEKRSEYTTTRWIEANLPGRRVYASGSTSFWMDAFADVPQMAGCCDQGQSMPLINWLAAFINGATGPHDTEFSKIWMQALGVDALVVNGEASDDDYKDFRDLPRFDRNFPVLHAEHGDTIYQVRPPGATLAHILHSGEQIPPKPDFPDVRRYVEVINSRQSASFTWIHGGEARISTALSPGDLVSVQVAWFPGWKVWVNGTQKPITADGLGLILIDPQCQGSCDITLKWTGPGDLPFAAIVSIFALLAALWCLVGPLRHSVF